jgi:hypothetical protein
MLNGATARRERGEVEVMPSVDGLLNSPRPVQDYIMLDGVRSPGRATVTGAAMDWDYDLPKAYGVSGAKCIFIGAKLSEFEVIIDIWQDAQWAQWASFAAVLDKPPIGTNAMSHRIDHPQLNRAPLAITRVTVRNVSQWEQSDSGMWTCRIKFIEFREQTDALGKIDGTIPSAVTGGIPDFSVDPQIASLVMRINKLGGNL